MHLSLRFVFLQLIAPATAGLGIAYLAFPQKGTSSAASTHRAAREATNLPPLPDNPELIRLAALSGRTTEARQKLADALAAGASDEELAEWLTPILIADPAWLEQFIMTVPEERRVSLIRSVLKNLTTVQPDALWELLRRSPAALAAAKAKVTGDPHSGVLLLLSAGSSPIAGEVIFDPEMHFTTEDIDRLCRFTLWSSPSRLRILEEWRDGRWKDKLPEWVRNAWMSSSYDDPSGLEKLERTLPAELQEQIATFKAYRYLNDRNIAHEELKPVDLALLSKAELSELCDSRATAGNPIPLETLQELPPELRSDAIKSYVTYLYPFSADVVRNNIARLDELKLSPEEKQTLLLEAGSQECNEMKDYDTAMEWFSRIGDETVRTKIQDDALDELMGFDPDKALGYIRQMPEGARREKLEKAAMEARP